jgi:hypothetical protein
MTYFPLRGLYPNLISRGSLVICPTQRHSYILTLGFLGKLSLPDYFSFRCSIGIDFLHRFVENLSSECMEVFMVVLISFL